MAKSIYINIIYEYDIENNKIIKRMMYNDNF